MTLALVPLDTDIWSVATPLDLKGVPEIGHRMTVVRAADGTLLLHSPVRADEGLVAQVKELAGEKPIAILAPSRMHDLFLEEWRAALPQAQLWAAPGLAAEHFDWDVEADLPIALEAVDGVDGVVIEGMPKVQEVAIYHEASRSLLVADLVFNLPGDHGGVLTRISLKIAGTDGGPAASRLFTMMIQDREAFRASLEKVLAWPFRRIVLGHGAIIHDDPQETLRHVYAEYLG